MGDKEGEIECLVCNKIEDYPGSEEAEGICSRCVQLLLSSSQEDIVKAYQSSLEKDQMEKAEILKSFLTKESINDFSNKSNRHQTQQYRQNLDRERISRTPRLARIKIRKEHRTRKLD